MKEHFSDATVNQWNNEFAGLMFFGEQQKTFPSCQHDSTTAIHNMYNDTNDARHYTQLNPINYTASTYQLLDSLDEEKRKMNEFEAHVKLEFDCVDELPQQQQQVSASLPDIRTSSNYNLSLPTRPKSLTHPPVTMETVQQEPQDNSATTSKKQASRPRMYKFNPKPLTLNPQMKRLNTPSDNKNDEYWEKRKKNNEASRRSRLARRLKECMVMEEMKKLRKENEQLKAELLKMQNSVENCHI